MSKFSEWAQKMDLPPWTLYAIAGVIGLALAKILLGE